MLGATTLGDSANAYSLSLAVASNAWSNTVGSSANARTITIGTAGNTFASSVGTAANTFASSVGTSANSYASSIAASGNSYSLTLSSAAFNKANSALQNTSGTLSGSLTTTGTLSDSKGDVRSIPINIQSSSYTLVSGDSGKTISITTGGVTVPSSVFSSSQAITIFNNSNSNQTISAGSGVTLYFAGTSLTGNRTLSQRGLATIYCYAANSFVISGAGLS